MPLYMDIHNLPEGATLEDVAKAHFKDLETQRKYGVEYSKYWLNEKQFEISEAFSYKLTPAARREIKRIIYEHFDYIVIEWKKHFKK